MNLMKLEALLSQRGLVLQSPSAEEIRRRAREVAPASVKLFYGETYDGAGNTVDSMKYYFFVASLGDALRQEGFAVDPAILVADTAACRNVSKDLEARYMLLGSDRVRFVEAVNSIYGTGLRVYRMSDYINDAAFVAERERVIGICYADEGLLGRVEKTVPGSKLEEERAKGFMYSFDEITTILDLDVKVGPPREDLYDNIAREIAQREGKKGLMSLFLTPTFPQGMNWGYFFAHEGIEDHGITAYKGASKGLQDHRVLVGRSTPEQVRGLIQDSFISTDPTLPNSVLDLGIVCEMARKRLEGEDTPITLADEFHAGRIKPDELKERVGRDVEAHILSRF